MTEQADLDVRTSPATPAATPSDSASRLPLSFTQILGSVLAAVSATVIASYFGVAGTVIGAAVGSLVSVVGGAVYTHSMNRTRDKIKTKAVESAVAQRFGAVPGGPGTAARDQLSKARGAFGARFLQGIGGRRLVMSAAALFMFVLGAVTAFELASGQPLSATVSAMHGSGTSLGGGHRNTVELPALPAAKATTSTPNRATAPSTSGRPVTKATPNPSTTSRPAASSSSSSTGAGAPSAGASGSTSSVGSSTPAHPALPIGAVTTPPAT